MNQTFFPSLSGYYAVEVTIGDCSSTSECRLVDFTGIDEIESIISVHPNPTKDELNVLCENKDKIGGFAGNYYWSSRRLWSNTEKDFTSWSWGQSFPSGYEFTSGNYSNYYVRAVRAF
ncbi:DUF1566 domain-containing protein [Crocinitomicaceae bacterium]|nr:DUF1566 domain-containing protein [Crocinitomicaceae bacterium]